MMSVKEERHAFTDAAHSDLTTHGQVTAGRNLHRH